MILYTILKLDIIERKVYFLSIFQKLILNKIGSGSVYGWGSTGGASQFDCTPFNSFPNILQEAEVRVWKHRRALIGQLCLT